MTTSQANKVLVADLMEAIGRGDVAAIVDAYTEDGYVETMGRTLISGRFTREQVAMAASRVLDVFPQGIAFRILNMTAEQDRVAVEATSSGEHVSGQHYANHYHFLFVIRDGKIAVMKEFMDTEMVTDIICGGQRPEKRAATN
jgi:ketosteroid isomerase-like protein